MTVADLQERVSRMNSLTALGIDMIHPYWLKKLTALHECLTAQIIQQPKDQDSPNPQGSPQGTVQSKYQPITCLSTT